MNKLEQNKINAGRLLWSMLRSANPQIGEEVKEDVNYFLDKIFSNFEQPVSIPVHNAQEEPFAYHTYLVFHKQSNAKHGSTNIAEYNPVALVELYESHIGTSGLEASYFMTHHHGSTFWWDDTYKLGKVVNLGASRSSNEGDVIYDCDTQEYFLCSQMGWWKLNFANNK